MTVHNKTIILTGAGGGMGKETAALLLEKGANVVGCDRNIAALQDLQTNEKFLAEEGDLLDETVVATVFQKAKDQFCSVDGLANILGIAHSAIPIEEVTFYQYYQLMDNNMGRVF